MRWVSTRVLPEPAPATMSSGPSAWMTASRWTGLRPSRRSPSNAMGPSRYRSPATPQEYGPRPWTGPPDVVVLLLDSLNRRHLLGCDAGRSTMLVSEQLARLGLA